jgi:hypothetical protein
MGGAMNKVERFSFVTCPLIFALVLGIIGMYVTKKRPDLPQGILLICSGLICACFYGVSSLLEKILDSQKK